MAKDNGKDGKSGNSGASDVGKPIESDDRIGMPNVKPVITREIERLTKELLEDMKAIIVTNVNYTSIDFIPEQEIEIDNQVDFIQDQWNDVLNQLDQKLSMGNRKSADFPKFLDMFSVVYNTSSGEPEIVFNLEFSGSGADDLSLVSSKIKKNSVDKKGV